MRIPFGLQIILSATVYGVLLFAFDNLADDFRMPKINYVYLFIFAITTFLIHNWLIAANRKSPRQFVTFFMGSITLKLFLTVTLLFVYLYFNREERIPVALSFMATYLLFTVLEVVSLYKLMTER